MPDKEEDFVITLKDDYIFGYVNVIDKVMHRKQPYIIELLRRKSFPLGTYRIRNGLTKKITHDEIKIIDVKKIMWISLSNDEAKNILGVDDDPQLLKDYGTYLRCLRKYLGKHDLAFMNHPVLFLHFVIPIDKPVQQTFL